MEIKLLPIGTIVELAGSEAKVMIAGYCPIGSIRPGYVWDYSGFAFPLGYRSANEVIQFDREQISHIVAMGYQDEEQFDFIGKLNEAVDDLKNVSEEEMGGE